MTRVGITGHQRLPPLAAQYADQQIRALLTRVPPPVVGISSLAAGADQLFARNILTAGGELWAVVPSRDYETTFDDTELTVYRDLLASAASTTRLDFERSSESAYRAAGQWIVDECDQLVAVWDGKPARGLGGTGDIVSYARECDREVLIFWPDEVSRD